MELRFKELDDLVREVGSLREELASLKAKINPSQEWYDLKQACQLKGVNYHTVISNHRYQPNSGMEDAIICGRRRWKQETIEQWIQVTDGNLPKVKNLQVAIGGAK